MFRCQLKSWYFGFRAEVAIVLNSASVLHCRIEFCWNEGNSCDILTCIYHLIIWTRLTSVLFYKCQETFFQSRGECHRGFVLRILVISPTFPVLMDLRELMDHLRFPKYPECSSGLKEVRISSIFSTFCMQLHICVDEWLAYLLIMTCMTFHYVTCFCSRI